MMQARCLKCYRDIDKNANYHEDCSRALFCSLKSPQLEFGLEQIEVLAKNVVNKKLALTGVQRKLSLSSSLSHDGIDRLTLVGFEGDYILKPPSLEFPELPEIEDLTMSLGDIFGLKTAPHGLIRMKDGKLAYLTRRFDRVRKKKILVEDFCQLIQKMTEDKYKSSSEELSKTIRRYSTDFGEDLLKLIELLVFCFITGNSDMHLKNFSLIRLSNGTIRFSPFYDLLSTRLLLSDKEDLEELALPLNGKKSKLKKSDFLSFSQFCGLPQQSFEKILGKFQKCRDSFQEHIRRSFLSPSRKDSFHTLINTRLDRLL